MKLLENMGTEDVLFSFPFSHAQLCLVSLRFFFFQMIKLQSATKLALVKAVQFPSSTDHHS